MNTLDIVTQYAHTINENNCFLLQRESVDLAIKLLDEADFKGSTVHVEQVKYFHQNFLDSKLSWQEYIWHIFLSRSYTIRTFSMLIFSSLPSFIKQVKPEPGLATVLWL